MEPRSWTKVRSDIAVAKRRDPDSDVTDLKRELKAARLAEHVRQVVESFPPLTTEQVDRIAVLLRGGGVR